MQTSEIISELEVRIVYTENQIKNEEKNLVSIKENIKFFEGELSGYKELLSKIQYEENKTCGVSANELYM